VQIYGNLLYPVRLPCNSSMVELKWYPEPWNVQATVSYTNWVVANNTLIGAVNTALGVYKRDNLVTNAHLRSVRIVNNILYDCKPPVIIIPHNLKKNPSSSWDAPPDQVEFDYNVISARSRHNQAGSTFALAVYGTRWQSVMELSRKTPFVHNEARSPDFVRSEQTDFRLHPTDKIARDTGRDLGNLGLPGLDTDLYGNPRGAGEGWDRGALECPR
jgi:hypothetical protein